MLPPAPSLSPSERKLLKLFKGLSEDDRHTLLKFAEFLGQRGIPESLEPVPPPKAIPRPEKETVIAAIKRLSATYPMLDKNVAFQETSALMTQHILHGKETVHVIDELEEVFSRHYQKLSASR